MVDIEFVYNVSIHKLQNFQTTRRESDGLRKLVLLNNFVLEKFVFPEQGESLEWSEEDIKKDEESWLDSCLDELDEDDYVHVNVKPLEQQQSTVTPFPINHYDDPRHYEDHYIQEMMEYEDSHEQQLSKGDNNIDDVIIPHDLLHLPYFDPGDKFHMVIEEKEDKNDDLMNNSNFSSQPSQQDYVININKVKGFHPYWKDNSIIAHPSSSPYFDLNTRSFGIPKIFHKYRFDQDDTRRIIPHNAVLELLQSDYLYQSFESPLRRSKDDPDILYPLTPKDLDRGVLMDRISMVECYGSKANYNTKKSNSNEINMWFMDDNHH